jgi:hypothetical protein
VLRKAAVVQENHAASLELAGQFRREVFVQEQLEHERGLISEAQ